MQAENTAYRKRRRRRRFWMQIRVIFLLMCVLLPISLMIGVQRSPPDTSTGEKLATEVEPSVESSKAALSTPNILSAADPDDWRLILVNPWNPLPDNCSISLTQLRNNQSVDKRCYPDLQEMMDVCRAEGLDPLICSSYRTLEKQEQLFQDKVDEFLTQGYEQAEAETEAGKIVAVPGTSEHQLGLAVDIVDTSYQKLDEEQEQTAVQKWLMEHCWEYGFILRYPADKSEVTGIIYEPWHYRYVGRDAAKEIHSLGICLEEYWERLLIKEGRQPGGD